MKRIFIALFFLICSQEIFAQITFGPKLGLGLSPLGYTIVQDDLSWYDKHDSPKAGYIAVPMIFGIVDVPISKTFSVRSGLGFRQQAYSYTEATRRYVEPFGDSYYNQSDVVKSRLNFLELPLYVSMKLPFCKRKFEVIAGGSVALNLGGHAQINRNFEPLDYDYQYYNPGFQLPANEYYETSVHVGDIPNSGLTYTTYDLGNYSEGIYTNKYNYSILAGIGYKITEQVLLNLEANFGITNMRPYSYFQPFWTNTVFDHRTGFVKVQSFTMSASYMFGKKKLNK